MKAAVLELPGARLITWEMFGIRGYQVACSEAAIGSVWDSK